MNNIPRRIRMDQWVQAEKAIYDAIQEVEKMDAHPLLTQSVIKLSEAQSLVADFVDGLEKKEPAPEPVNPLELLEWATNNFYQITTNEMGENILPTRWSERKNAVHTISHAQLLEAFNNRNRYKQV